MRILFIGGCADGRWEEFDKEPEPFRRVLKQQSICLIPEKIVDKFSPAVDIEIYRIMQLNAEFKVYIAEHLKYNEILKLLINNYRPIV